MSSGCNKLQLSDDDVKKLLAAQSHLGSTQCDFQMLQYVYKRRLDGVHIIDLKKMWEKLMMAARIIACIENPADVCAISGKAFGQRAVLKFSRYLEATSIAGRFTPGTFTNQITRAFKEPRVLIITDPKADHQAIAESSYVNIPVIAFCNTESPLKYVDVAIPCNNKSADSIGLMWWLLCRAVLRLKGSESYATEWNVMPDLFIYRDPEEAKEEEAAAAASKEDAQAVPPQTLDWGTGAADTTPAQLQNTTTNDWSTTEKASDDWGATAPVAPPNPNGMVANEWANITTG